MAVKRDPYRIMDIPPVATTQEIKSAYRKKSKMYHPDVNPDLSLWSDEKMSELVEAYNIISDEDKRKEYDSAPHFQIKRSKKLRAKKTTRLSSSPIKGKPTFKSSSSLLDRIKDIFSFSKKKDNKPEYNPKEADVHFSLGVSLCDNPKFLDQAVDAFSKAVDYDPEHIEAYFNLAMVHYRLGHWAEARSNFQKVLAIEKTEPASKLMIGLLQEDL